MTRVNSLGAVMMVPVAAKEEQNTGAPPYKMVIAQTFPVLKAQVHVKSELTACKIAFCQTLFLGYKDIHKKRSWAMSQSSLFICVCHSPQADKMP